MKEKINLNNSVFLYQNHVYNIFLLLRVCEFVFIKVKSRNNKGKKENLAKFYIFIQMYLLYSKRDKISKVPSEQMCHQHENEIK